MNNVQFDQLQGDLSGEKLYGQFLGLTLVTDNGFAAASRKAGWRKVTVYNVQLMKKSYFDVVNTSTGAVEAGIEIHALRDSHYESEGHHGFFSHLASDPNKKYVRVVYDANKSHAPKTIYLNAMGEIVSYEEAEAHFTDSYRTKMRGEDEPKTARAKVLNAADIDVRFVPAKVENIAVLKVGGVEVRDPNLKHYLK